MAHHIPLPPILLDEEASDSTADGLAEPVAPEGAGEGQHIAIPAALAEQARCPPQYTRRSAELMQHARDAGTAKRLKKERDDAKKELSKKEQELELIARAVPAAGALLGRQRHRMHLVKNLQPRDICGLAIAAHWPPSLKGTAGMNRQRLSLVASRIILQRQQSGLNTMLANAKADAEFVKEEPGLKAAVFCVTTHSHEWDETAAKFKSLAAQGTASSAQISKAQTSTQTLVQRGSVSTFLHELGGSLQSASVTEEWIVPPHMVPGTRAEHIHPAVMAGMPSAFRIDDPAALSKLRESTNVHIYLPIGDKASANVLFMKWQCCTWEDHIRVRLGNRPRYLIAPSTCQIHSHHRGKLQIASTKPHIAKHYSIGSLFKLHSTQLAVYNRLEHLVHSQSHRRLDDPPGNGGMVLRCQLDALYGFAKPHHRNEDGVLSKNIRTLLQLVDLLNGESGTGAHFCGRQPRHRCCTSETDYKDKLFCVVSSLFLGRLDAKVCESRWTNLLPALKKSLLRKVIMNWGVASLDVLEACGTVTPDDTHDVDRDAFAGARMAELNGIRIGRLQTYYGTQRTWMELAVLVPVLDCSDEMLFHMLGGQDRLRPPGKTVDMVKRNENVIGTALQKMLQLAERWSSDDPTRSPWCLLDAVGAPKHDQAYKKWARAQIMKAASVWGRRYEGKFSSTPYALHKLASEEWNNEEKQAQVVELLRMPRCCLDPFTFGLLLLFGSEQALLSSECKIVVDAFIRLGLS